MFRKLIPSLLVLALALTPFAAFAETTFDGSVVAGEALSVTAPFGGAVASLAMKEGAEISLGDTICTLETTKVYAPHDGVVSGVFGQPGDAVDTVTAKIALVMKCKEKNIPIISSMGAGNKLDGSQFRVADIYKTKVCPLAKVMRRELKKRGVKKLKVVYSEEQPTSPIEDMAISCRSHCICPSGAQHKCTERRDIPGSVAFVPSVAGLIIAGEVVKDLCGR